MATYDVNQGTMALALTTPTPYKQLIFVVTGWYTSVRFGFQERAVGQQGLVGHLLEPRDQRLGELASGSLASFGGFLGRPSRAAVH